MQVLQVLPCSFHHLLILHSLAAGSVMQGSSVRCIKLVLRIVGFYYFEMHLLNIGEYRRTVHTSRIETGIKTEFHGVRSGGIHGQKNIIGTNCIQFKNL